MLASLFKAAGVTHCRLLAITTGVVRMATSDSSRCKSGLDKAMQPSVASGARANCAAGTPCSQMPLPVLPRRKSSGDMPRLASLYAPDFSSRSKNRDQWLANLQAEIEKQQKQAKQEKTAEPDKRDKNLLLASMPASRFQTEIKDVSFLRWSDTSDTMVATFGELAPGQSNGRTVRQYWSREPGGSWKIFFEAVI